MMGPPAISRTNVVWMGRDPQNPGCEVVRSNFAGSLTGFIAGFHPAVSGTHAVWESWGPVAGVFSNFAGQLASGATASPHYPDVSGTNVVWVEHGTTPQSAEIWTNFGGVVVSGVDVTGPVAISGTSIVWAGNDSQIYMATFSGGLMLEDPLMPSHVDDQGWHYCFLADLVYPTYVDPLIAIGVRLL
ncbi:MAG: hypothetical protein KBE65_05710, partial [Phycisphaerae bacterium]|nr:hypothetical protein [Phycisphaerae bacterium]